MKIQKALQATALATALTLGAMGVAQAHDDDGGAFLAGALVGGAIASVTQPVVVTRAPVTYYAPPPVVVAPAPTVVYDYDYGRHYGWEHRRHEWREHEWHEHHHFHDDD